MSRKIAITKLKAVLIIDILIVAIAAGAYLYLVGEGAISISSGPKPAEFSISQFIVNPTEVEVGEPVSVSVNVTNIGESEGNYTADLLVDGLVASNQTVTFASGESNIIEFLVTEEKEGNYTVQIAELSGSFTVKPAPPVTSSLTLSAISITPYESWVGAPVNINVTVNNPSGSQDSIALKLAINGTVVETKNVELGPNAKTVIGFVYTPAELGKYNVKVHTIISGFVVVPTGMHTIFVRAAFKQVDFKLNGVNRKTPYSELLPAGVPQTVEMPVADPTGKFAFLKWEDGSTNPKRIVTLTTDRKTLSADFSGGTSCPSLYMWNGTDYVYVSDVSNHGWLGYIDYVNSDGSITFWRNNPWDYIPLNSSHLKAVNNVFNLTLVQKWDEIFYLDQAYMMVVDHPAGVNVYSTMVEQYLDPNYMGQIYTVSKNPLKPISAVNEKGENVLPQISSLDNVFTQGVNGIQSPSWNNITWNKITLNLGNLAGAQQIKLLANAVVNWGSPIDYNTWLNKFFDPSNPVPNGTQVTPPPIIEVKAANGSWIPVPESRQFPLPPDGMPRTFVVDLTGLFPTNDYSVRISNFWNVTFDYIGVDITPQQNLTIHKIDPTAYLYQSFQTSSLSAGNFTRYGNVTELVTREDDEFVIGKQGDAVSMQFDASTLPLPAEGMVRDYFFYDSCWFKDENGNWGFGFGFTVDPLPFSNMSGFPYPLTESYPLDAEHLSYLSQWNTRTITPSPIEQGAVSNQNLQLILLATTIIIILAVNMSYVIFRVRSRHKQTQKPQTMP
jgi:hypothetical protein